MTTKKITIKKKKTKEDIITDKVDAIRNNLLGSYDDEGNYTISTQIADELKRLKKLKKTVFNNSLFCSSSKLGYGEIVFEITFEKNSKENIAVAKLFILESVYKVNGYLQNTIKTLLEEFKGPIDNFIERSYDYYMVIVDPDEDGGKERKDITEEIFKESYILAKKQYSLAMDKLTEDKYNEIYAKLFARRIEVLKSAQNEFSSAVLKYFDGEYQLIEDYFLTDKNYKALNDLLDNSIEMLSGTDPTYETQEKEIEDKLIAVYDEFEEDAEKIEDKAEFKAFDLLNKKDKEKIKQIKESKSNRYKQVNGQLKEQEIEVEVEKEEGQIEEKPPVIDDSVVQLMAQDEQTEDIEKIEEERTQTNRDEQSIVEENIDNKVIDKKLNKEEQISSLDEEENTQDLQDEIDKITKDAEGKLGVVNSEKISDVKGNLEEKDSESKEDLDNNKENDGEKAKDNKTEKSVDDKSDNFTKLKESIAKNQTETDKKSEKIDVVNSTKSKDNVEKSKDTKVSVSKQQKEHKHVDVKVKDPTEIIKSFVEDNENSSYSDKYDVENIHENRDISNSSTNSHVEKSTARSVPTASVEKEKPSKGPQEKPTSSTPKTPVANNNEPSLKTEKTNQYRGLMDDNNSNKVIDKYDDLSKYSVNIDNKKGDEIDNYLSDKLKKSPAVEYFEKLRKESLETEETQQDIQQTQDNQPQVEQPQESDKFDPNKEVPQEKYNENELEDAFMASNIAEKSINESEKDGM